MDRLVIMDSGRIVEQGTHAELLRKGGIYASLWARQSGGFIKDAAE
jgi:ABC-type multidrug transport system fused ATPase/permease subunit